MNYHRPDKRNPNLPKWALMSFGPLQSNIGVLNYFDRFSGRPDTKVPPFRYEFGSRSLTTVRRKYRLDSVAGSGDDTSKAVNLSRWLCDSVPPGGASAVPNNSLALLEHSYGQPHGGPTGLNCAQFAVVLSELLLSIGICARIVILQDFNPNHGGNHCVTVAWCRTRRKWVMVDPLYHAFYSDGNGTVLNPWEIRHHLVHQQPVLLNADWGSRNHPWNWSEATLLTFYAKNLCYMGSPLITGFASFDRKDNTGVWLIPKGFDPIYRELKLQCFYRMRDSEQIDFQVSRQQYLKERGRSLAQRIFTSSLKSFASSPE